MVCPDCEKLMERVEELEKLVARPINEYEEVVAKLVKENQELKRRLALYENAHVPPSQRRYPTRCNGGSPRGEKRFPGRPKGHPGTTRPVPKPDVVIKAKWDWCPRCGTKLGKPARVKRRIIEDIPEPQPVVVKEFLEFEGDCLSCGAHVIARHPDCPPDGRFGKNLLIQVSLWKYEGRLPHHRIREMLKWQYGLSLSTAAIFDITRRVSDWLIPSYEEVRKSISRARVVYSDWTGVKVDGTQYWTWDFVTNTEALIVVRKSKRKKVLEENLGKNFPGTVVCDGDKTFPNFTRNLQRCWAHMLREADYLAEHIGEANPLQKALHKLYSQLKISLEYNPPLWMRARLAGNAKRRLRYWLKKRCRREEVKKFVEKVRNGFNHWFTFVTTPGVEPTNNRAERALREHVVQRKIIGTFRNEKGTSIYETIMTMLATWKQRELDPSEMLAESLVQAWGKS